MSESGATAGRQTGSTPNASQGAANASKDNATLSRLVRQMRASPLVVLLIAGAASIALVAALFMWAGSPEYRVLYSNLDEADGGRIITELDSRAVPYRFSDSGQALMVPADQVHMLRLQLAEQGLPRGGNLGLELMDNQAFGISQFAEQVNFQRGLEGELARSIESLGPVERVRVHLSMAKPSVFIRDREPAKASVVLTLAPGRVLGEGQVSAIVHMVSSSVPELAAEAVTVVDQSGRLLSAQAARGGNDLDGSQLEYIAEVERSYQRRIENILTPILGSDNVRAQVAAQIDFSRREQTSERYGPNQPPNEAALRSRQLNLSFDGENPLAGGIPGALSNTPPGVAASLINQPDEEGDEGEGTDEPTLSNLRQEDIVNYEVDRSIEHVQQRLGQIQRLSAAVVVDFRTVINSDGEAEQVALTQDEINQLERLVQQAMGFSEGRGDQIEVVNTPFVRGAEESEEETTWWQQPATLSLAATLGRYLMVLLVALLLYLLILRPLIKRYTQTPPAAAPAAPGSTFRVSVGDDEDESVETDELLDDEGAAERPKRRRKTSLYENNLKDLQDMAKDDPRMVAMIIRSWMNANE
ncbi:flagellar basal-body MS-ring/collar protein FliF [Halomonas sp. HNIBRBA4712]|uniref:flagellar basal-body MS-ring/collar protein FliF n=1 Tax=Halomonas sp. HNIBRBA4712 TaxID=3373087 RepID=UPI003746CC93